jgi:predicted ATPase/class 3 adenylate cyclase
VSELPSGTVTFLFTDIESSTHLWEAHPDAMRDALARHDELVRDAIEAHDGHVVKTTGDGFHAAFGTADAAVVAAVAAQRALDGETWPLPTPLRARMGLHTGTASARDGDYYGSSLNRAARLMGVAHGGQIVCSQATADLARDAISGGVALTDLGEHRLRDLSRAERVYQVDAPGRATEFAALTSVDALPGNLPLQVSSFIGRERDVERTVAALHGARVVTLTGVGGVGKTRLALQVAAEVLPRFRDGAWLIELAPVRDPAGVIDAFTAVFGVTGSAGQALEEALTDFLRTKQLLLMIDNCEHVLDAVAEIIEEISTTCPRITVMATSREGLALDGERILAVPALAPPDLGADLSAVTASDAVQLFVDRACAADADFELGAGNADAVAQVCRRLDGVPLAIELAAARVTAMSLSELATALDRRFDVLAGGRRRAVKRQQTLRATIDWSYDLLDEHQRRLLSRLAVFTGGCTRDAAERICGFAPLDPAAVFGLLTELVDRSLVVADRDGLDTRYRLLETIREYGEERLVEHDETETSRERHARYYAGYARRCREGMAGPGQVEWGARMGADGDNILAAFGRALEHDDLDLAVELVGATTMNQLQTGYALNLPVAPILAMPAVEHHPGYPLVLMAAAFTADANGDWDRAREYGDAAVVADRAVTGPRPYSVDLAMIRCLLRGMLAMAAGAWEEAAEAFLDAVELAKRETTDGWAPGMWLGGVASMLASAGRHTEAVQVATEGIVLARESGMPAAITINLTALAQALAAEEPDRARALLLEAAHTDAGYEIWAEVTQMALAAAAIPDWTLTARFAAPSIRHLHWRNQRAYLAGVLNLAARVLGDTDPESAAIVQGAARTLAVDAARSATAGTPTTAPGAGAGVIVNTRKEATRLLVDALGRESLQELRDVGAAMDTDQAVAYTLTHLDAYLRAQREFAS